MAKLTVQDFKKELSSGKLKNIYLIFGTEKYLVKKYTEQLINKAAGKTPSEFDFIRLDSDAGLDEIFDSAEMLPMFSERKCVCVTDYDINALSESDYKQLAELAADISPSTVLIFTMPTLSYEEKKKSGDKKQSRFKKWIAAVEKSGSVLELNRLEDMQLERTLVSWADRDGSKLTSVNAAKIISMVGSDLTALRNEMDKLTAYADGGEITREIIELLCVKNTESNIYAISNSITANDFNATYRQLHLLFGENEKPEIILYYLSSAFVDMYRMRVASESGKTISDVGKDFKYGRREFVLKNARASSSRYSTRSLRRILDAILETDIKLKSTRGDSEILLETLVAKLLIIAKEGNAE
ncbi:MAG: DNA polymerase III subunit delta [Clostridia bacterium]|nr:DNA polymerase III subunit delta [Clostridia bacterium]